jgi:hypothetical protein
MSVTLGSCLFVAHAEPSNAADGIDCRGETKINYWFLTVTSGDGLGRDARHTISV